MKDCILQNIAHKINRKQAVHGLHLYTYAMLQGYDIILRWTREVIETNKDMELKSMK